MPRPVRGTYSFAAIHRACRRAAHRPRVSLQAISPRVRGVLHTNRGWLLFESTLQLNFRTLAVDQSGIDLMNTDRRVVIEFLSDDRFAIADLNQYIGAMHDDMAEQLDSLADSSRMYSYLRGSAGGYLYVVFESTAPVPDPQWERAAAGLMEQLWHVGMDVRSTVQIDPQVRPVRGLWTVVEREWEESAVIGVRERRFICR